MSDLHSEAADKLFDAILALKDREECYRFFEDLCTITEMQAMSQRFHVARLLRQGLVYNEVGRLSGASSATISRVNRSLQYGKGGYGIVVFAVGLTFLQGSTVADTIPAHRVIDEILILIAALFPLRTLP